MNKLIIFILILGLLSSCGKDCTDDTNPSCTNYNPCKNVQETKADFWQHLPEFERFKDMWSYRPDYLDFLGSNGVALTVDTAKQYEYIEWQIGSEKIYNQRIVTRTNFPENEDIPITLIVKNKPNKICLPNDDGIDTITKTYRTYSRNNYDYLGFLTNPLSGKYEMQFSNHPTFKNKFTFNIIFYGGNVLRIDKFPDCECNLDHENGSDLRNSAIFSEVACSQKRLVLFVYLRKKSINSKNFELKVKYYDGKIYYAEGVKIN